jgi:hypothetical protein
MKKYLAGTMVALVAVSLTVFAGAASGDSGKDTKITFAVAKNGFGGTVDSTTKKCIEGRTVKVLKRKHHRELLIAHTTTNADGQWLIARKHVNDGTYLAKVLRTPASSGIHCAGDRSGKVVFGG